MFDSSVFTAGRWEVLRPATGFSPGCWRLTSKAGSMNLAGADAERSVRLAVTDQSTDVTARHGQWEAGDSRRDTDLAWASARTLTDGLRSGVQVLTVATPRVQIEVALTRGGGITGLAFDGVAVGWESPIHGPVHPGLVPLDRPDGLGWLAGFDEVLARCGLFNVGGPQFDAAGRLVHPLHGTLAHLPCHTASVAYDGEEDSIIIETSVDDVLFHFHRLQVRSQLRVACHAPRIELRDTVTNLGGRPAEILLLQHWNFGPPVAVSGSQLDVLAAEVAPRNRLAAAEIDHWSRLAAPQRGSEETVYFIAPAADTEQMGVAILASASGRDGLCLRWDLAAMPYLTLWKNPVAVEDGYAVGIEPGTCYPNGRDHETEVGRGHVLGPGQSLPCRTILEGFINDPTSLSDRRRMLVAAQKSQEPVVYREPQAVFGPVP